MENQQLSASSSLDAANFPADQRSQYEVQRDDNIEKNKRKLRELGLESEAPPSAKALRKQPVPSSTCANREMRPRSAVQYRSVHGEDSGGSRDCSDDAMSDAGSNYSDNPDEDDEYDVEEGSGNKHQEDDIDDESEEESVVGEDDSDDDQELQVDDDAFDEALTPVETINPCDMPSG